MFGRESTATVILECPTYVYVATSQSLLHYFLVSFNTRVHTPCPSLVSCAITHAMETSHVLSDTLTFFCRYFHEFEQRIPRAEMVQLKGMVEERVKALDERFIVTVCGSFRRGER